MHERFGDARRAEAALRAAAKEGERAFGAGAQQTLMFTAALALHLRRAFDCCCRAASACV